MFRSSPPGVDPRCLYDNKVRDAVKRMRRERKRRGQRGRGRPKKSACQRRGPTRKEPANFVFGHRHLIVTKDENLSDQQRADLPTMFQDLLLQTLRNFVDKVSRRFEAQQSPYQAHCRRAVLLTNGVYAAIPELATTMTMRANPAVIADFGTVFPSGTLNFAANETSKILTINVKGDTANELDKGFTVMLSSPSIPARRSSLSRHKGRSATTLRPATR